MLLNQEIFRKCDEELFLKNLVHVDLHYQINPITKRQKNTIFLLRIDFNLLVEQIFDRYIFLQYLVENQVIPKIVEKIRKRFVYVAMMLLMLVRHLHHLFHLR